MDSLSLRERVGVRVKTSNTYPVRSLGRWQKGD